MKEFLLGGAHMAVDHLADSGMAVHSWEEGHTVVVVVEGGWGHIPVQHWLEAVDTHLVELGYLDM
jgi:hypothetical protein